jgi:hypothetical protein
VKKGKERPHFSQIKNESVSVRHVNLGPPALLLARIMVLKPLRVGGPQNMNCPVCNSCTPPLSRVRLSSGLPDNCPQKGKRLF